MTNRQIDLKRNGIEQAAFARLLDFLRLTPRPRLFCRINARINKKLNEIIDRAIKW